MIARKNLKHYYFSYSQLMIYGVHVGHSFLNSLFYTAWLVYSYSQNILILNLFKTLRGMKSGIASVLSAAGSYQPTWFINLDQAAGIPVRSLALSCGEFSATSFWICGFISNYLSVYNTYRKLKKLLDFLILVKIKMRLIYINYDILLEVLDLEMLLFLMFVLVINQL